MTKRERKYHSFRKFKPPLWSMGGKLGVMMFDQDGKVSFVHTTLFQMRANILMKPPNEPLIVKHYE